MVFQLTLLQDCLFGPFQQMIDLDTGEAISIQFYPEEARNVKNGLLMPLYTKAPICQAYLSMLESQLGIVPEHDFSQYPVFKYEDRNNPITHSFVDKAMHFFEETDWMLLRDRESDSPKYDTKFPVFLTEYFQYVSLEVTKDWCSKVGIEWY